jgi:hypothetical protein
VEVKAVLFIAYSNKKMLKSSPGKMCFCLFCEVLKDPQNNLEQFSNDSRRMRRRKNSAIKK